MIPTTISDEYELDEVTKKRIWEGIKRKDLFLIEEHKVARRRWIKWGFDREMIDSFIIFNEHNQKIDFQQYLQKLKDGQNIYLMSDCGLPAFCDPGRLLIEFCHKNNIKVTSLAFSNSVLLALTLSGFESNRFRFLGFIPRESENRIKFYQEINLINETCLIMDTPYRLNKVIEEVSTHLADKRVFLAMNLQSKQEDYFIGPAKKLKGKYKGEKAEFVLVIE